MLQCFRYKRRVLIPGLNDRILPVRRPAHLGAPLVVADLTWIALRLGGCLGWSLQADDT